MASFSRSRSVPGGLLIAVSALLTLTVGGTIGYRWIEGFSYLDSLFMTVITLSTVGYGEVHPLSPVGRGFSIVLIMVGLGIALYTVGAIAEFLLEDRISGLLALRKMKKRIDDLSQHIILVGFGRFGTVVGKQLVADGIPFVVIDIAEDVQPSLKALEVPFLMGSALEEDMLIAAGIERARAIVVGTGRDADNVFVALCARDLNPEIRIHARAETETGERRLRNAGAEQVVSPLQVGGQRIANALVRPAVLDFIELTDPGRGGEIDLEEVLITDGSDLEGHEIGSLAEAGVLMVVGLKQGPDMQLQPDASKVLAAEDSLVVVGRRDRLRELSKRARSPRTA